MHHSLEKHIIELEKSGFFLISSMDSGLLDELQIFLQLCLIELLGLLTSLGQQELQHLIYQQSLECWSSSQTQFLWNFRSDIWSYFLISVIGSFRWFWMGSLYKNFQLLLEFLKGLFLVLHISFYILMTFLIMLSVIWLFILFCSKCDMASDQWQQLELASELKSNMRDTVDWARKQLFDFNAGKTQLVLFHCSKNTGVVDVKLDGSVLEEKLSVKILD